MKVELFEDIIVANPALRQIGEKMKLNIHEALPEHLGHKVRIYYDGSHIVWVECLDCKILWTHCSFCNQSKNLEDKGAKRIIDFGCRKCKKEEV